MRHLLSVVILLSVLAACAEAPQPPAIAPMTLDYTRLGLLPLQVKNLDFRQSTPLNAASDANFANYKPRLADAAYRWGVDRLRANGSQGRAVLTIGTATITRNRLAVRDDIGGWFTRAQSEKWVGQLAASLTVEGAGGGFSGTATANVTRSTTLPEDASASEKENAYRRLLLGLMDDFNAQMTTSMREHLQAVLVIVP
jgi:hypothetical protein